MYNSILKKISMHAKENNITLTGFHYNFRDSFPTAFYDTVINYLERANPNYNNSKPIHDFYIAFDKNKNAYFEFVGKDDKTKFLVLQDDIQYNIEPPKPLIIKESIFLENVSNLDNAKNHRILSNLPVDFIKRFLKDSNEIKNIDESFKLMALEIIDYMKYLEEELNISYSMLNKELKEAKELEKIYFFESEPSENKEKSNGNTFQPTKERKNDEISFHDRKTILDSYESEHTFEAEAKNTSAKYYVKVFKTDGKYKLVTEPKEANKYTKVVYINKDVLSKQETIEIVIDALELSRNEITNSNNITRHSHTTLEEYKKLLEYLLNQNNLGIHYGTKDRIDKASGITKR